MSQTDIKVCVVGSLSVGKSCITKRFIEGTFDENYYRSNSIGFALMSRSLYLQTLDVTYKIILWDTVGQERFRSVAPHAYRSAAAALVVYDITDQESFDDVNFWITELRRKGPEGILIYVVGNKIDLESDRVVVQHSAESYAQAKGAFHFQTSAKTGEGIEEIFYDICISSQTSPIQRNRSENLQSTLDVSNYEEFKPKKGHRNRNRRGCRCRAT